MTPPAVLKRRSEGTKRTEHYPAEISCTWYRTILAGTGAGTRLEKMAGYPANQNRISGTSLIITNAIWLFSVRMSRRKHDSHGCWWGGTIANPDDMIWHKCRYISNLEVVQVKIFVNDGFSFSSQVVLRHFNHRRRRRGGLSSVFHRGPRYHGGLTTATTRWRRSHSVRPTVYAGALL